MDMLSYWVIPGVVTPQHMASTFENISNTAYEVIEFETGITREQIRSKVRKRPLVDARKIMANILRRYTNATMVDIGSELNVDHSTIVHYERVFQHLFDYEEEVSRLHGRVLTGLALKCLI